VTHCRSRGLARERLGVLLAVAVQTRTVAILVSASGVGPAGLGCPDGSSDVDLTRYLKRPARMHSVCIAVAAAGSLGGCSVLSNEPEPSRLDLTVQNERSDPVTARVVVTDEDGTTYDDETDQVSSGVAVAGECVNQR
jgi:hypothetical protein